MADVYINYPVKGPFMDRSMPENQVSPGMFGYLAGIDGRHGTTLRRFPGMNLLLDLTGVTGLETLVDDSGVHYFKTVGFQKTGTSDFYRGFVIAWDSQDDEDDLQVDLVYSLDNGSTWAVKALWAAGNSITASTAIDCANDHNYLYVTVSGVGSKTVYYDTGTPALTVIAMGPGNFYQTLPALTLSTSSIDTTSSYFMRGNGIFNIAYRFYSSTRGIFSAMSTPLTVVLDHTRTTKATGYVQVDPLSGDQKFVDGDVLTIGTRTYEFDDDASYSGDVQVDIDGITTLYGHILACCDAINSDASGSVYATPDLTSFILVARTEGSDGNAIDLSISETGSNTGEVTVSGSTLSGGGNSTDVPSQTCKIVINFPDQGTPTWFDYTGSSAGFADLYDSIQVFRSIDLGMVTDGAILYNEQTVSIPVEGSWNALTATLGDVHDEALVFYDYYNPEKDIVKAPPSSGVIGRYQGVTFMAQAVSDDGGLNTEHSSLTHESGEYFSTFNEREGSTKEGKPLRYIQAGDSMILLAENSITNVHKGSDDAPLEYSTHHLHRGLLGRMAAHAVGNSVILISNTGLMLLNSNDMNMGQVSSASRVLSDDWTTDIAAEAVSSGYDGRLDSSFFLSPTRSEMIQINHTTQTLSMVENCLYTHIDGGPSIEGTGKTRLYCLTSTGSIVLPDWARSGSGTMDGLDGDTLTLEIESLAGNTTTVIAANDDITLDGTVVGTRLYIASGDLMGESSLIASYSEAADTVTVATAFSDAPESGTRFLISPVVFKVRMPCLRGGSHLRNGSEATGKTLSSLIQRANRQFSRITMTSLAAKFRKVTGYAEGDPMAVRVGAYRDSATSLHGSVDMFDISQNPSEAVGAVTIDGVDVEPYLEHFSVGKDFELTGVDVGCTIARSRNVAD